MKLGNFCVISSLPKKFLPVESAAGLQDIIAGGEIITEGDEKETITVLVIALWNNGILSSSLHQDIQLHCKAKNIREVREEKLTADEIVTLLTGNVLPKTASQGCSLGVGNK